MPDADFAGRGAVRDDLAEHLTDAAVSKKQISGGHDMNNFMTALADANGKVILSSEKAPGIYEVQYRLPNSTEIGKKTICDSTMYPDMSAMAEAAAGKALIQYQATGNLAQEVIVGNIKFTVPIRMQNGQPYVPTAYAFGGVEMKWGKFDGVQTEHKLMCWVFWFVLQPYFDDPLDHWLREVLVSGSNIGGDPSWEIEHVPGDGGQEKYRIWADSEISGIEPDEVCFGADLFRSAVRESLIALGEEYPERSREAHEIIARYGL